MKKHLLEGVKKGAFTAEEAESRFQKWIKEKQDRLNAQADNISKRKAADAKKRLEAETKVKEAKAQEVAKKLKARAEDEKAADIVAEAEEAQIENHAEVPAEKTAEAVAAIAEETVAEAEETVTEAEETISAAPAEDTAEEKVE